MKVELNPNHYNIRVDRATGELFLTHEKGQRIRRIKNITGDVLLALCADLTAESGVTQTVREVKFNPPDGEPWSVNVTLELQGTPDGNDA